MPRNSPFLLLCLAASLLLGAATCLGQQPDVKNTYGAQELSESDGVPVLIKHLPDLEQVSRSATFAKDTATLKKALGERPELDIIDFAGGTEAVTAAYPSGKLLIVEYASPQASVQADGEFTRAAAGNNAIVYRRIGNYNALVFDVNDRAAAEALLDQVKYEKQVQWLGKNPHQIDPERKFVLQAGSLFISTLLVILMGIGIAVVGGLVVGYLYFLRMEKRRSVMRAFTDAGGMTRLNLDGFTPEISPDRLLNERS
jgi:hypothetical protein